MLEIYDFMINFSVLLLINNSIMKKQLVIITVLFLCLVITQAQSTLTYIESSSGLGFPAMEGGRTELEFADINADGHIDILSIGDHGSPYINTQEHGIMVWFGDGSGNWEVYQNGNFGYGGIAVGDVNNDGFLDVGYAMHHNYSGSDFGDQLIEVALGDGTGMNWTPWDDGLATNGETWGMFGTDFADIDNDGYLDLGSVSFGSGAGVHIYRNMQNGSWEQSFGFLNGNSTMIFDFGDINNDGYADFAVTQQYGTVYFGGGDGSFVLMDLNLPSTGIMGRRGTSLGDVDNDGGKDLAYINSNGGIEVWEWSEWDELWQDFSGTLPETGDYQATQLYDMNVDGFMDIAAFGEGTFTLWLGDGAGTWTQDAQFTLPSGGYFKAFRAGRDIDNNGFPDFAMVVEQGSWPSYQNHLFCFKESSTPEVLSITPIYPHGNEVFLRWTASNIDWISAVPENQPSHVSLEYSINGNNGDWIMIAENLPNNGRFQWEIPYVLSDECYIKYTVWSGTESASSITPTSFSMFFTEGIENQTNENIQELNCYPNPFQSETTFTFTLNNKSTITLTIYDLFGKKIKTLENQLLSQGKHTIMWDGTNRQSRQASACSYFAVMDANGNKTVKKIIVMH